MKVARQAPTWLGQYRVSRRNRLYVDATPGDGAVGHVVVSLGRERIFTGTSVRLLDLGPAERVTGSRLLVTATLRRVAPQATWTSLGVILRGGAEDLTLELSQVPSGEADVTFLVQVDLAGETP